jgi:hypothetical protein
MANYRERLLTESPTGPSFSTARRERSKTSATLGKPLTRESLVDPDEHLSTPEGSGLFAARTPRLPRIHANRVDTAENTPYPSNFKVPLEKIETETMNFS